MNKVVLITGISSGFGKQTAGYLAQKGHIVYGTVRKDIEVSPNVHILKIDLTNNESIKAAVDSVVKKEGRIDVLINNAGMHTGGSVETTPIEHVKLQMDTNFIGLIQILRAVLPIMRKQRQGTIINFSSIGGLMGLPFQAFYSASKFAIEGLSEALRMELREFNIKVVVINPGDFHTSNTTNRQKFISIGSDDPYETQFRKTLSIIEKDETGGWPPEFMARKLYRIIENRNPRHHYVISSFEQKLAVILKRILPNEWFDSILRSHYGI
jgi:NAD(P)-dependent dehydrogenase (short-subunit alcohol dehydrogenase family)